MPTYVIGDLQGCHARLCALLEKIDQAAPPSVRTEVAPPRAADAASATSAARASQAADHPDAIDVTDVADVADTAADEARYVFVGDLVNRGPQSLETLRLLVSLGGRARTVLGNHDLHLLAAASGTRKPGRGDTLDALLAAPDRDVLLDWLRRQPLALALDSPRGPHLVVHAGVLPQWSAVQTLALAGEVEAALRSPDWLDFLHQMYGNQPDRWRDDLQGIDRLRCIVNALTRLRWCDADGVMHLGEVPDDPHQAGLYPWFAAPGRRGTDATIVYGHWSALGLQIHPGVIGLDTGCLWGGKLTAVRLEDHALFQVDCPQHRRPAQAATSAAGPDAGTGATPAAP